MKKYYHTDSRKSLLAKSLEETFFNHRIDREEIVHYQGKKVLVVYNSERISDEWHPYTIIPGHVISQGIDGVKVSFIEPIADPKEKRELEKMLGKATFWEAQRDDPLIRMVCDWAARQNTKIL